MNNKDKNKSLCKKWELVNFCEFDKYAEKSYCTIHNVDESKNLGDITKVDETKLSPFNMICGGSPCFVAGTKVITKDGYKNIEDIKVGDMVLTHKNRFMPVLRTGGDVNKDIYKLKVQGFLETECTDYHPFYCKKTKDSEPEKIKLRDLKKGYYVGSHINLKHENIYNLSDEDCWILGRYVADGHIRKDKRKNRKNSYQYQCILSIGSDKVDELKCIVKNRHYSCYPHTKSTHRVVFSSIELVEFIIRHNFGNGAENKTIPNFILNLPVHKLKYFLDGYMAGDGCNIGNIYQATTVSKELAMSLCLVIQKVYHVGCCIYYDERPDTCIIENMVVNQKDTYMIRFRKNPQKHSWFIRDDIVWYPIREISKTDKVENVYNIEVKEDHTYTANNIITFNCQDFSVAGKQKGSIWTCKDCNHEYNPLTVHWSGRDKCPHCGSTNLEKTRSSLLVEYLRVIRANKPNFGIYENVKNIVGKQFKETTFKLFTDELEEYGYNVYWKVLNAKHYGIPQNRERVYLIFIKKELDNGLFKFPEPFDNGTRLKDILENKVDEKYYISEEKVKKFIKNVRTYESNTSNEQHFIGNINRPDFGTGYAGGVWDKNNISPTLTTMQGGGRQQHIVTGIVSSCGEKFEKEIDVANTLLARDYKGFGNQGMNAVVEIPQATKKGYIECEVGGVADLSYPDSKTRRGRVQDRGNISPTITATETGVCKIEYDDKIINNNEKSNNIDIFDNGKNNNNINCKIRNIAVCEQRTDEGLRFFKDGVCGAMRTIDSCGDKRVIEEWQNNYSKVTQNNNDDKIICASRGRNPENPSDRTPGAPTEQRLEFNRNGCTNTLTSVQKDNYVFETNNIRIRKLTPRECFRLMGFSDDAFDAAEEVVSNTQLYKQAGNSIVVDVLYYIFVELYKAMPYLFDDLRLSSFFSGIGAFECALDRLYNSINNGNFLKPQAD